MTPIQQHLAANMKLLRKKRAFSQAQLAEKAGTSTNYIAMIETSKKFPSPAMLEKLAIALNIESPELFSQKGIMHSEAEDLKSSLLVAIGSAVCGVISEKLLADSKKNNDKV